MILILGCRIAKKNIFYILFEYLSEIVNPKSKILHPKDKKASWNLQDGQEASKILSLI